MDKVEDFTSIERKSRPTVWNWMQRPRSVFSYYVLAVHKRRGGHWISIKGGKICDTFTGGKWVDAAYGPNRGCRIIEVFQVKRVSEFAPLGPLAERPGRCDAAPVVDVAAIDESSAATVNPWVTALISERRFSTAVKFPAMVGA